MAPKREQPHGTVSVVYARYSSHAQNDASIEQQVAECRAYAESHGLTITEIYADRALSGRSDKRPEFQKMMRHADAGRFQVVLTYKSNRLARNMFDALRYEDRLEKAGVKVVYCKEDFGNNAAGRLALRMMMSINEFYSENMAEDIRRGMRDNAQQCKINGALPLGYRRGEDGRYVIHEAEAEIVREIFRRAASGEALAAIADDLNSRGLRTSHKQPWGRNSFHSILKNERYIGVYKYEDIRVEGGIPPIVDRSTFEQAREKLRRRQEVAGRRRETTEYLLTGKLYCGHCGEPMTGVSGTSKSGDPHCYYICRAKREKRGCAKRNVRKDRLECQIAAELKERILKPDVIEWMIDNVLRYQEQLRQQTDLMVYQDRLVEVRRSLDNLVKAIEAGVYSSSTRSRLDELESEQIELQGMIEAEQAKNRTLTRDQIRYYLDSFKDGDINDPAYQKRLFRDFLVRVYLYDDKYRIIYNYIDGQATTDFPLSLDDLNSLDTADTEDSLCSYSAPSGPPQEAETNTYAIIRMLGWAFVLTVYNSTL